MSKSTYLVSMSICVIFLLISSQNNQKPELSYTVIHHGVILPRVIELERSGLTFELKSAKKPIYVLKNYFSDHYLMWNWKDLNNCVQSLKILEGIKNISVDSGKIEIDLTSHEPELEADTFKETQVAQILERIEGGLFLKMKNQVELLLHNAEKKYTDKNYAKSLFLFKEAEKLSLEYLQKEELFKKYSYRIKNLSSLFYKVKAIVGKIEGIGVAQQKLNHINTLADNMKYKKSLEKIDKLNSSLKGVLYESNTNSSIVKCISMPMEKIGNIWMSQYEVRVQDYERITGVKRGGDLLYPVTVNFLEATQFCEKINQIERESGRLNNNEIYRLPNRKEWYSALGSIPKKNLDSVAWFEENSMYTIHRVGLKRPNEFGLYDMLGNVWEHTYNGEVILGGGFDSFREFFQKVTSRIIGEQTHNLGFRIIRAKK